LHLFEYTLYTILLALALGIPFFIGDFTYFGWETVFNKWLRLLPFVLIFLANNFLFVPRLLFREKYVTYIVTCILSVIIIFTCFFLFYKMPAPPHLKGVFPSPGKMPPPPSFPPPSLAFGKQVHLYFSFGLGITAVLMIGFNVGVKSFMRWSEDKIRQTEKERHQLHSELAFLKHQISPHFFMNTLNNIHALVDINAQDAKNAIIKLSHLMRYLLYESNAQRVLLKKEINFIESYIELMRLRYNENILSVETEFPENIENVYVPSSLFLSFIENAFKHGVHPHIRSVIKIRFSVENDRLTFCVVNYLWNLPAQQTETTGIGLENVRKRLDLIYKEKYTLDIHPNVNTYTVILKIPVS